MNMKYQKANVEVVKFELETFMESSNDTPLGNFTCKHYKQGESCSNVTWGSGYSCGVYTPGNCQQVYAPPGTTGDGCYTWKLTCSKF